LDVVLADGFLPQKGDEFALLGGLWSGQFDKVNLPWLGSDLMWDDSQLDTSGIISVVPEPASLGVLGIGTAGLLLRRRRS